MTEGDQPAILMDALRTAGITSSDIKSRTNIEQRQLDEVLQIVLKIVPDISLRMFAKAEISDLGVMGYAAMNTDTVGKAMAFLLRYHELTSDWYFDTLTVDQDVAKVFPTPRMAHIQNFVNIAEDSLAGNWRMLGWLLGPTVDYAKAEVHFDFPEPDYVRTYREVFGCPFFFRSRAQRIAVSGELAGAPDCLCKRDAGGRLHGNVRTVARRRSIIETNSANGQTPAAQQARAPHVPS